MEIIFHQETLRQVGPMRQDFSSGRLVRTGAVRSESSISYSYPTLILLISYSYPTHILLIFYSSYSYPDYILFSSTVLNLVKFLQKNCHSKTQLYTKALFQGNLWFEKTRLNDVCSGVSSTLSRGKGDNEEETKSSQIF